MRKTLSKPKFFSILLSIALCVVMAFALFVGTPSKSNDSRVFAESTALDPNQVIGNKGSGIYSIDDENLYDALWSYLISINPDATNLTVGCFKDLVSFPSGLLNNKGIKSINGLYLFDFSSLKSLDLSQNNISGKIEALANMPKLENINLSNNKIAGFDGTFSSYLKSVNLKNNNLKSCNISSLNENGTADLSFNKLSSFANLTLPNNNSTILLTHNNLLQETPQEISCTLNMGLQGLADLSILNKNSVIKYYHSLENVAGIKLYKKTSDNQFELLNEYTADATIQSLVIGEYKLVFDETTEDKVYSDIVFEIKPDVPTFEIWVGEEQVQTMPYVVKSSAVVKLFGEGEIYYSINNGEAKSGSEITIEKSGAYTITVWQKVNGMESEKESFLVNAKFSSSLSIVWIVLGALLFVAVFYLAYLWKESFTKSKISKNSKKGFN